MRLLILLSLALAGCSVELPAGEFSCTDDDDCLSPNRCVQSVCQSATTTCVDDDGDGFGVEGASNDCPACAALGNCVPDCDDTDPATHPGADDLCDSRDNDCSGDADEVHSCVDSTDCPHEQSAIGRCEADVCVYYSVLELQPGCGGELMCVSGKRQIPDGCE